MGAGETIFINEQRLRGSARGRKGNCVMILSPLQQRFSSNSLGGLIKMHWVWGGASDSAFVLSV